MKALLIITLLLSTIAIDQTKVDLTNSKEMLIGEWKFVKVIDQAGNEVKQIKRNLKVPNLEPITINASGPDIIVKADGTYTKVFTPKNSDTGNWYIQSKNEILYQMVIPINSRQGRMIIKTQEIFPDKKWEKDGKGNFLDGSIDTITELTKTTMKVVYEKDYVLVYAKILK
ncbi:hypothetical protein U8527_16140 [Kordia algicida OT-1]|uniref:Lipocalin-like domain-containing protein n=1 Tax=Kordia algicida OT-1 TaxID=391587 RepID=A9E4D8_9FLAO|nr:hypothetical protein [Kordia algicida]EDP95352.1 hypothetical protein KAOT1_09776 [Kordia algicida OT-1]